MVAKQPPNSGGPDAMFRPDFDELAERHRPTEKQLFVTIVTRTQVHPRATNEWQEKSMAPEFLLGPRPRPRMLDRGPFFR